MNVHCSGFNEYKEKRRGEWTPMPCKAMGCNSHSLVVAVAVDELYRILIQLINDSPSLNLCNVVKINFQLTRSKAFYASIMVIIELSCLKMNNELHQIACLCYRKLDFL